MQILILPPKILRERHIFLCCWSFLKDWQSSLGTRLCLHHCFPTTLEFLKTSIEIEPSISLVVLMDSKKQSRDMVEYWIQWSIVQWSPVHSDIWINIHMGEWPKVFLLWITTHEFWVYVSTKTVGKQWLFQVPKLFSINMKTLSAKWFLFMCWQTSFHQFDFSLFVGFVSFMGCFGLV